MKNNSRWSDQHMAQLRSQIEAFKLVIKSQGLPKKEGAAEIGVNLAQVALKTSQAHERAMESYREKFENFDLDCTLLIGKDLNLFSSLQTF